MIVIVMVVESFFLFTQVCMLMCYLEVQEFLVVSVSSSVFKFCIGLFYRPPSSPSFVLDDFYTTFEDLMLSRFSNFVLVGDFNIDYLNPSHAMYPKLTNLLQSFSLTQVVPIYLLMLLPMELQP